MSIELSGVAGDLVTVKITGKVSPAEQVELQKRVVERAPKEGGVNVLVLAQGFEGWEKGDWGDVSFQSTFDQHVRKMAIVGDQKWRDLAILFTGKGLRRIEIEMFPHEQAAKAWLAAGN